MQHDANTLYKTTGPNGACVYGRGSWTPGKWRTVTPPLRVCSHGIHYARRGDLVFWLNAELWLFEDGGDSIEGGDKMVTTRGRIIERVDAWNETNARLFAADCAEAVVHLIPETHRAPFTRSIEVARLYAHGEASDSDRAAAWAAAGAAAWAAAGAAARAAAGAAARAAAGAAAWAAAGDAAWDAARAAAGAAAWDAARAVQTELLFSYLSA